MQFIRVINLLKFPYWIESYSMTHKHISHSTSETYCLLEKIAEVAGITIRYIEIISEIANATVLMLWVNFNGSMWEMKLGFCSWFLLELSCWCDSGRQVDSNICNLLYWKQSLLFNRIQRIETRMWILLSWRCEYFESSWMIHVKSSRFGNHRMVAMT